ncbi:O-methyltransferase family 2 protein [Dictyostelium discoideum AX4]|uniref:O-methyltransferase 12 n=1 Tax=Dictyostelium discoideum TaxID=44689 RepID=OMT12_DICDI|nr:O-methyltransferase family 2 protein [Dictyostelium discoideum AX4]Q54B59.1 RecName: Full=O-methyltransferase 12 [Dictyostelium discoideum]EAL60515.1 O-methyltransferase family 2 protein [Dictyostelium discoideum AX4]|eukprot:XP_628929.1 O-methyltransferase family 2 protein [Dictyostelium discoideum AX4]
MSDWDKTMDLLFGFVTGHIHSRMFETILKFSICDLLEDGPKHYSEISKIIGFKNESYCYRLMRYFVPYKLFNESVVQVGLFSKTPSSTQFSKNGTLKNLGRFHCQDHHYRIFESLPKTLEMGKNQGPSSIGLSSFWEHFETDESYKQLFHNAMKDYTSLIIDRLISKISLSPNFKTVVDIGGSHGFLIGKLLESNPNIHGINFDLENIINSSTSKNENFQHPRLKHVSGDFFNSVPEADCYILKYILHDWSDEKCITILNNIHKSLKPNGKLFINDLVLDPSNYTKEAVFKDILMMQYFDAKERSINEWHQLFEKCGFKIDSVDTSISPQLMIVSKINSSNINLNDCTNFNSEIVEEKLKNSLPQFVNC